VTDAFTHNIKDSITKFGYAPVVPGAVTDEAAVAEGWSFPGDEALIGSFQVQKTAGEHTNLTNDRN
jgi:hypothetical protein